jgi:proton glutamate symport protein
MNEAARKTSPEKTGRKPWWCIFRNPWVNLVAVLAGAFIGHSSAHIAGYLAPFGEIYLALLQMCVLPIIMTAITVSIGKLLGSGQASMYLKRVFLVFAVGVLMTAALGSTIGILGQPGDNLPAESRKALGRIFLDAETQSSDTIGIERNGSDSNTGFWALLNSLVPSNVFFALSTGQSLAIVFFSIIFGAAIGTSEMAYRQLLPILEQIYNAFFRILAWALLGLPFGLLCILSDQVAKLGTGVIIALAKLVILFFIACILLCVVYILTLRISTRKSLGTVLNGIKEPMMISFVVSSSVPAIPIALNNMSEHLDVPSNVSNFAVPLGVIINRQGYALLFALTAVFVAQLYEREIIMADLPLLIIGSALAGMAAVGAPAVIAPMLGYVLVPLGLPPAVGIAIFIAISPAVDAILSMTNLCASCASSALIGNSRHASPANG